MSKCITIENKLIICDGTRESRFSWCFYSDRKNGGEEVSSDSSVMDMTPKKEIYIYTNETARQGPSRHLMSLFILKLLS